MQTNFFFTNLEFWYFFAACLLGFCFLYKNHRLRNIFLLVCSLFFYYKISSWAIGILAFSIVFNWAWAFLLAKRMAEPKTLSEEYSISRKAAKSIALFFGILVNVLILCSFKLLDVFPQVLSEKIFRLDSLIIPIGISFFSFQAISYLVDVYKGEVKACKNILYFGLYLSFFPAIASGPIVRAKNFLPQLKSSYLVSSKEFYGAIFLILCGLAKKILIADNLSSFVNPIFENGERFTSFEHLLSIYAYSVQLFCDFSGYTDIAIGLSALLGFSLPKNFDKPYRAFCLSDFWHRWHISLSTWLRDYIYIPLGGNRKGAGIRSLNILVVMLIGGLWHGFGLSFLVWGGLNGIFLAAEKLLKLDKRSKTQLFNVLRVFICFNVVSFLWLIFRCANLDIFFDFLGRLAFLSDFETIIAVCEHYWSVIALIVFALFCQLMPYGWSDSIKHMFKTLPYAINLLICIICLAAILYLGSKSSVPFIYFKF